MSEMNERRSIATKTPTFDDAWLNGECWFVNEPQPSFYDSLIEAFEHMFPDEMRQAREQIEAENPNPVRRTRRN